MTGLAGVDVPGVSAAPAAERTAYGVERLGALTDGVFAIVMTLLVLELKVPEVAAGEPQILGEDLVGLLPNFVAWLVSFVLLARFWIIHHDVLSALRQCHLPTVVMNFVLLGLASLIPFASALIGTYELQVWPVTIFSAVVAGTGLAAGLFSRHVKRLPASREDVRPHLDWHWRYNAFAVPLFAVLAVALSVTAHPVAALGVWLAEPVTALVLVGRRR